MPTVWRSGKMWELREAWRQDKENVDQSSSCDLLEVEQRDISDSEIQTWTSRYFKNMKDVLF